MNIFILDTSPGVAATLHADTHLNKMILESAQMLSTAAAVICNSGEQIPGLYKPTHVNHPCNIWVRESFSNACFLYKLAWFLDEERAARFSKHVPHKSLAIADEALYKLSEKQGGNCITPFAEAVPDHIKSLNVDTVTKYQLTYLYKRDQGMKMTWTGREIPEFMR